VPRTEGPSPSARARGGNELQLGGGEEANVADKPTYEEIETRARELWELRGRPQRYDSEFWAEAERELSLKAKRGEGARDPDGSERAYDIG
jgi:hypothetical protein